jgi:hypothetical protein
MVAGAVMVERPGNVSLLYMIAADPLTDKVVTDSLGLLKAVVT